MEFGTTVLISLKKKWMLQLLQLYCALMENFTWTSGIMRHYCPQSFYL